MNDSLISFINAIYNKPSKNTLLLDIKFSDISLCSMLHALFDNIYSISIENKKKNKNI